VGRVAANIGYDILAISTPDKFLEHVHSWQPSRIMVDLQMPVVEVPASIQRHAQSDWYQRLRNWNPAKGVANRA